MILELTCLYQLLIIRGVGIFGKLIGHMTVMILFNNETNIDKVIVHC